MKTFPLSLLALIFGLITRIRNLCYDKAWIKSFSFPKKNVVVIGNLAVGGTGKSPFVNYLLSNWPEEKPPVILSRGYGRRTKGFLWAGSDETSDRIGDEPLTYRLNFPDISIALGENRVQAINQILNVKPETKSILLDDAFQHRALRPSLAFVCTTFQNPYYLDELMPKGRLRESIDGIKRAQAIVVNKCPNDLSEVAMNEMTFIFQQKANSSIPVFFTSIKYGYPSGNSEKINKWHAFAGIAQPELFFQYIADQYDLLTCQTFADHYTYQESELVEFNKKAAEMSADEGFICTYKDYVRLIPFLNKYPFFGSKLSYLPMEIYFLRKESEFMNWFRTELQKSTS